MKKWIAKSEVKIEENQWGRNKERKKTTNNIVKTKAQTKDREKMEKIVTLPYIKSSVVLLF